MSSTLYWHLKPKTKHLPDELKQILSRSYDLWKEREFSGSDLEYLRGLHDAGIKGAEELIELIERHDSIFLKLEC